MKTQHTPKVAALIFGLMGALLSSNATADVIPVATNSAVIEFNGGAVTAGTNYLVGYISGTNMTVQLVSGDGQLSGAPVILGANPGFPPAAALAGAETNCLAAWSDTSLSSGVTMFGQIISTNGTPVGAKFPLLASAGGHGFQYVQAAASDGTNFLVVWQASANTNFYGQLVSSSGTLLGAEFPLFSTGDGLNNRNVTLAFGRTNYLAAWQSGMNGTNNTYGELISLAGDVGSPFPISATSSMDENPRAVAFDGTNYLAVWSRDTNYSSAGWPNWNLCGRLVSPSGAMAGDEKVLVTENATLPGLAFDGSNYLLLWGYDATTTNTDVTIHAQFFDRSARAIGPVFHPFPAVGTYPPLLPINGVLFDGQRFLLTATYAAFAFGTGGINGLLGGDVYGRFLPASSQPPVFANASIINGQFHGDLEVVPGQTYTIEICTNLPDWTAVDVVSSPDTNMVSLVDPRGTTNYPSMFYRVAIGNSLPTSYFFSIHEFASGGNFSGYTPVPSYPVSLQGYTAWFEVKNDPVPAPVANVRFTGPVGSGLANTVADTNNSRSDPLNAYYQSPQVSAPAAAPGGSWTVDYDGTSHLYNIADPQAASRLVIPLPTVSVNGSGEVQSVSWTYRDPGTGADLGGAPAYMTDIQVQIEGVSGGRIYDSPLLSPADTNHNLTSVINWSNVQNIFMAYTDTLGNQYIISFNKP